MCNDAIAAALLYGVADPTQRLAQITGDRVERSLKWRNRRAEKWKIVGAPHELTPRSSPPGEFPYSEQHRHQAFILCGDSANDGSSEVRHYATLRNATQRNATGSFTAEGVDERVWIPRWSLVWRLELLVYLVESNATGASSCEGTRARSASCTGSVELDASRWTAANSTDLRVHGSSVRARCTWLL
jgi:hypothetical protein